jgi:peptidyl-tRNA hydrolase
MPIHYDLHAWVGERGLRSVEPGHPLPLIEGPGGVPSGR